MKLCIMQPYLFPYLGYWQMLNAVDTFVIYDDVNYIKQGFINRNNILINGKGHLFALSLDKASPFKKINETNILGKNENRHKVLAMIKNSYLKAPHFKQVFTLIEDIINYEENNLALFLENHFIKMFEYLDIDTKVLVSSKLDKDCSLKAQDKVLHISKKLNADTYINAIGGQELYNKDAFAAQDIKLKFIKMKSIFYPQFKNDFAPNLSIVDVMMFNDKEKINNLLSQFDLI